MPQVVTIKLMNHGELPLSSWSWRSILQKYVRLTRPFRAHYRPLPLPKESIHKWCPIMNLTFNGLQIAITKNIIHMYYISLHTYIIIQQDCFLIAILILWSPQFMSEGGQSGWIQLGGVRKWKWMAKECASSNSTSKGF